MKEYIANLIILIILLIVMIVFSVLLCRYYADLPPERASVSLDNMLDIKRDGADVIISTPEKDIAYKFNRKDFTYTKMWERKRRTK